MIREEREMGLERLDVGAIASTEDMIFYTLMKEKGASKSELSKLTRIEYPNIRNTIIKMEDKGYVIGRTLENKTVLFYLTQAGVYEAHDRLNYTVFCKYHNYLCNLSFPNDQVCKFLRNAFYNYYLSGVFPKDTLEESYISWCLRNGLEPNVSRESKLKLKK